MLDIGMGSEMGEDGHDDRDPGLVVRPKEGIPARDNEIVPDVVRKRREFLGGHGIFVVQANHASIVILDDLGFDVLARAFRGGVHVGVEADRVEGRVAIELAIEDAEFVDGRSDPHLRELFLEEAGEVELLRRAWDGKARFVALGVDLDVPQEAV